MLKARESVRTLKEYHPPLGNREGAPGLFLKAPFGAYLDNFSLSKNQ